MNIYRMDSSKSSESYHHDDVDHLKNELECEKSYRDNIKWRNAELEKDILKLQEQLQKDDFPWEHDEDLHSELLKIDQITEEIKTLKEVIPQMKDKLKNAKVCGKDCRMKHDDLNINLDIMNEIELLKTIKRLERMRTDLKSALISKEWSLDNESKMWNFSKEDGLENCIRYLNDLNTYCVLLQLYQRVIDQKINLQNALYHTNVTPAFKMGSALDRWQNGGIPKGNRILDLKRGPINQFVARGKLPMKV